MRFARRNPEEVRMLSDLLRWPVKRVMNEGLNACYEKLAQRRANGTYVPFERGVEDVKVMPKPEPAEVAPPAQKKPPLTETMGRVTRLMNLAAMRKAG